MNVAFLSSEAVRIRSGWRGGPAVGAGSLIGGGAERFSALELLGSVLRTEERIRSGFGSCCVGISGSLIGGGVRFSALELAGVLRSEERIRLGGCRIWCVGSSGSLIGGGELLLAPEPVEVTTSFLSASLS